MSLWRGPLCPPALQGGSSSDVFFHVVTPDRIPQFIIPSRDSHKKQRCSGKGAGQPEGTRQPEGTGQPEGTAWRSSSDAAARDEHGLNSSCLNSSCSSPDPTAWAALSLPHLPRVTTPYGFVTLGRSPQVTREEAFFHSGPGHPRGPAAGTRPRWQEEPGCCRHPGIPGAEGDSGSGGSWRDHEQPSASGPKDDGSSPALPRGAGDIQRTEAREIQEAEKRDRRLLGLGWLRRSSSLELPAATGRKNLFQRILGRHLVHPRQLKPGDLTLH